MSEGDGDSHPKTTGAPGKGWVTVALVLVLLQAAVSGWGFYVNFDFQRTVARAIDVSALAPWFFQALVLVILAVGLLLRRVVFAFVLVLFQGLNAALGVYALFVGTGAAGPVVFALVATFVCWQAYMALRWEKRAPATAPDAAGMSS